MANRLINEQSPYLLQHAHNPVNWYPWGDDAFETAKREHKPVIVSIGYAACHWCHVMERESFENEETAAYMNEHFINIKVDREEHPDVDQMYMDAVQAITQSGGWPLNVFVTPERVPFYGGTYYPPKPMYSRPSWMQVLQQINNVWLSQQDEVVAQSEQMLNYLKQLSVVALNKENVWHEDLCRKAADAMLAAADTTFGGFGSAPKFPATMSIQYLLEHYHFTGYEPALKQAIKSLDSMADGGIYDQIGGGFARYSTDAKWLAPHFEKMLYDNALLIMTYTDAYKLTGNEYYKQIAVETIDFVKRELQSPLGGFYSALDADSEGVEGKFYTWTWEQWIAATGGDEILEQYWGISRHGNWEETNILHKAVDIAAIAKESSVEEIVIKERIAKVKEQLFEERSNRIRPATDDKCLLSWNALMNMALSRAGQAFADNAYIQTAQQHMQWMQNSYNVNGAWMHTWKEGLARIPAKLDDLTYLQAAMLQLASVSGDYSYIHHAATLTEVVFQDFLHENKSFFYYSSKNQKDIPVRKTDLYDGSSPSANSMMAANLITLGMLMERSDWVEQGRFMVSQMSGSAGRYPTSFANWAIHGQRNVYGNKIAVLTGVPSGDMWSELQKIYHPNTYVVAVNDSSMDMPITAGKDAKSVAAMYVCDEESCSPPIYNLQDIAKMLKNK